MPGSSEIYLLDTSLFIQAHRNYYAFDLAPGFWENLKALAGQELIKSIDKVYDEILRGGDELYTWVSENLPKDFFLETDNSSEILKAYQSLMEWANQGQYNPNAREEFAEYENADAWIVAAGVVHGCTVVSQEVPDLKIRRRIPLPNPCQDFGVRHIDTFTFMRECGFRM